MRNKKIIISVVLGFLVSFLLAAQSFPRPRGYVNDFANVVGDQDSIRMEQILNTLEEETGIEVAVVTLESMAPLYGYKRSLHRARRTVGSGQSR